MWRLYWKKMATIQKYNNHFADNLEKWIDNGLDRIF